MAFKFRYSRRLTCLLFFQLILCSSGVNAQRFEFGAGAGILHYRGDLNPSVIPNKPVFGLQLIGRYNISMAVVLRGNILLAPSVSGSSLNSPDVNIRKLQNPAEFNTYIGELGAFAEYNFFNYRNPKNRFVFGSPYLFGGPACFVFQPTQNLFEPKNASNLANGSQIGVQPALVIGLGYKQQLGQYFNLGFEASGRFLFTDYLDGVSNREISKLKTVDPDGNEAIKDVAGVQRGNPADNDFYLYIGATLTYTIKEIICPFKYQTKKDEK